MSPTSSERDAAELEDGVTDLQPAADLDALNEPELAGVYPPPARIAARLQQKIPGNRRRSSATSSRRNSLSSNHSHLSNRSLRNSGQSHQIAHQLRRASILETRRARLADRAAHAEQVRLRAALAKASPRTSNSEEKAVAAQQAREKYLAKVAAACAEEVNRAKKVAEETKEKKAAEERRCRQEIEERHAEAERRRQEHYKRNARKARSTSMALLDASAATSVIKPETDLRKLALSEEQAACRIQRLWRRSRRRKTLRNFLDLNISVVRLRRLSYEECLALIEGSAVKEGTAKLVPILQLSVDDASPAVIARMILAAYMVISHTAAVPNGRDGPQTREFLNRSEETVAAFEAAIEECVESRDCKLSTTSVENLKQTWNVYSSTVDAYKRQDASTLITTLVDQFVVMQHIWDTVKSSPMAANDYREGIRTSQTMLIVKLNQLIRNRDQTRFLIKKALREAASNRPRQRAAAEIRPRPVDTIAAQTESSSADAAARIANDQDAREELPQAEGSSQTTPLGRLFSAIPSNRVIAHELLLNPQWRIEASPHSNVKNALNREICNGFLRAFQTNTATEWTVAVAQNIRSRLLKMLPNQGSMHRLIDEALDYEYIRAQCQRGEFSYMKFFQFMADILPRLCAPVRDKDIKELCEGLRHETEGGPEFEEMVEKLFNLLHAIDIMSLDYTNYWISQAAPHVIRGATAYEISEFEKDLTTEKITLQRTKHWWRDSLVNLMTETGPNAPHLSSRASFEQIYARGLTNLTLSIGPLSQDYVPETLSLDFHRLDAFRRDMLRYTIVAGILLTAKNLLKRDVRSPWRSEARRVIEAIQSAQGPRSIVIADSSDNPLTLRIVSIIEATHPMPVNSRDQLTAIVSRYINEAFGSVTSSRLTDPVLKLIWQRLRMHVFTRLAATTSTERVRAASTASEGLGAIGLGEFIGPISGILGTLEKVKAADLESHGTWYRAVSAEIESDPEN